MCNMIIYFTLVYQYSTDKITKAFIVNANLVSLLITGLNKKVIKKGLNQTQRKTPTLAFWIRKLFLVKNCKG